MSAKKKSPTKTKAQRQLQRPSNSQPVANLPKLAKAIRREHAEVVSGLRHAKTAGVLLQRAKAAVPHGQWMRWVAKHVRLSMRTVDLYMCIATHWARIGPKLKDQPLLTINEAVALVPARTVPRHVPPENPAPEAIAEPTPDSAEADADADRGRAQEKVRLLDRRLARRRRDEARREWRANFADYRVAIERLARECQRVIAELDTLAQADEASSELIKRAKVLSDLAHACSEIVEDSEAAV